MICVAWLWKRARITLLLQASDCYSISNSMRMRLEEGTGLLSNVAGLNFHFLSVARAISSISSEPLGVSNDTEVLPVGSMRKRASQLVRKDSSCLLEGIWGAGDSRIFAGTNFASSRIPIEYSLAAASIGSPPTKAIAIDIMPQRATTGGAAS